MLNATHSQPIPRCTEDEKAILTHGLYLASLGLVADLEEFARDHKGVSGSAGRLRAANILLGLLTYHKESGCGYPIQPEEAEEIRAAAAKVARLWDMKDYPPGWFPGVAIQTLANLTLDRMGYPEPAKAG